MSESSEATFTAYKIPLSVISHWPPPNTINPITRTWLVPVSVLFELLTTLVVSARIFTRLTRKAGSPGLDDILIVFAWAVTTVWTGTLIYAVLPGKFDRHIWDAVAFGAETSNGSFVAWLGEELFLISTGLTKVSLLLCHRRIVAHSNNKLLKWSLYATAVFTVLWTFAFILALALVCEPTSAIWTSVDIKNINKPFKCADRRGPDISSGVFAVVSDLYTLVLPALYMRGLNITGRQKAVLYGIFCCGVIVIGMSAARTYAISRLTSDPQRDLTWIGYSVFFWSMLEQQLAIICASVPALRPFVAKYLVDPVTTKFSTKLTSLKSSKMSSMPLSSLGASPSQSSPTWAKAPMRRGGKELGTSTSCSTSPVVQHFAGQDTLELPQLLPRENGSIEKNTTVTVNYSDPAKFPKTWYE